MHKDGRMTQAEKRTVRMGGFNDSVLILKLESGKEVEMYCEHAELMPDIDEKIIVQGSYPRSDGPPYKRFEVAYRLIQNVVH